MKLNDTKDLSNEKLEELIKTSPMPEIVRIAEKIRDIRQKDQDVLIVECFKSARDPNAEWKRAGFISETLLYEHLKRKTGLTSNHHLHRITIYFNGGVFFASEVLPENEQCVLL